MFPGDTIDNALAPLVNAAADPSLTIAPTGEISPTPRPPPLTPLVYGTAKTVVQKHFPGVPMLPAMSTAPTGGRYFNAAGIPRYGVPGRFSDPNGNGGHGLNQRRSVEGLFDERDYLFNLIQAYADSK
jgi:acetylornithine deacetylase/succinyl-diaminopimelate desuccinylase-like protein